MCWYKMYKYEGFVETLQTLHAVLNTTTVSITLHVFIPQFFWGRQEEHKWIFKMKNI